MKDGNVNNNNKNNNNYVWPVRSGEWTPSPRVLFPEIYRSYLSCRRRKRNTINALAFEVNAEENIYALAEKVSAGTYKPGRTVAFVVDKPKLREIIAADFKDRVMHHYLVERLEPLFERVFIHDSYACRKGKGTHHAVKRVKDFMRKGTVNDTKPLYALHLDIKNFFMTIDREILSKMIEKRLCKDLCDSDYRRHLFELFLTILHTSPIDNCSQKGSFHLFDSLPPHKSLFKTPPGKGLPVGNLTSQFFANVYLNELDQYCKHTLKCKYYVRYCDDFLILDSDPKRLVVLKDNIREFVADKLQLTLNERYAAIRPVKDGVDFLGFIIRPEYTLVRRRVVNNFKVRLASARNLLFENARTSTTGIKKQANKELLKKLRATIASYLGHFKWANTNRLRKSIFQRYSFIHKYLIPI